MLPLDATGRRGVAALRKVARPRMPVANAKGEVVGIVLLAEAFQAVSRRETLDDPALLREVPVVPTGRGAGCAGDPAEIRTPLRAGL
jgi:putative hemolysin